MLIQVLAERLLCGVGHPLQHQIEGVLGDTNGPHTVVDSTGSNALSAPDRLLDPPDIPQAALNYLQTYELATD